MAIILASASPRRHELLARAGVIFEIVVSPAEELHDPSLPPSVLCEWNAALKARAVATERPEATVIGADTLVFLDGEPLGKPTDMDDARAMLRRLAGQRHHVCTGVCVIYPGGKQRVLHAISEVTFHPLDDAAIAAYFELVNPLDKAGAYGIQEHGERIIARIDGQVDNVMGLPVAQVLDALNDESTCGKNS